MVDYAEIYLREHSLLRDELRDLKDCQIKFLTFAVTSTALLLGYLSKSDGISSYLGFSPSGLFLIPLTVLLPAWCIFFNKATTISRIVGYYMVLEGYTLKKYDKYDEKYFKGWENSLEIFREKSKDEESIKREVVDLWDDKPWIDRIRFFLNVSILILFQHHHPRYWVSVYTIFFWLSWTCVLLSLISLLEGIHSLTAIIQLIAFFIVVFFSYDNLKVLYELISGFHSYTANKYFWEFLLKVEHDTIRSSSVMFT